jgi:hypothetical protein
LKNNWNEFFLKCFIEFIPEVTLFVERFLINIQFPWSIEIFL